MNTIIQPYLRPIYLSTYPTYLHWYCIRTWKDVLSWLSRFFLSLSVLSLRFVGWIHGWLFFFLWVFSFSWILSLPCPSLRSHDHPFVFVHSFFLACERTFFLLNQRPSVPSLWRLTFGMLTWLFKLVVGYGCGCGWVAGLLGGRRFVSSCLLWMLCTVLLFRRWFRSDWYTRIDWYARSFVRSFDRWLHVFSLFLLLPSKVCEVRRFPGAVKSSQVGRRSAAAS